MKCYFELWRTIKMESECAFRYNCFIHWLALLKHFHLDSVLLGHITKHSFAAVQKLAMAKL